MRYAHYVGKYQKFSFKRPRARAVCQISGLDCMREDMVKQMEYAGNGLYWKGIWVNKKFADKPNPSLLAPRICADPYPIHLPVPEPQQSNGAGSA